MIKTIGGNMEVKIENEEKCELFLKIFPLLFDSDFGNFESYVLRMNNDGLSIKQRDISGTIQFCVKYTKNALDYISNEDVYIKFNGYHIRKLLEVAKKTIGDSGITLKYTDPKNPYLQVFTTQKYSIRLESLTDEDEAVSIGPYTVDKYAIVSNLDQCSKLISTLGTILNNKKIAPVELVLSEDTLTFHAMDDEGVKEAHHDISCTSNTRSIQKVNVLYHHLEYIARLIDAGATRLKFYLQTDNNLIFEITFPYEINITIYAAKYNSE